MYAKLSTTRVRYGTKITTKNRKMSETNITNEQLLIINNSIDSRHVARILIWGFKKKYVSFSLVKFITLYSNKKFWIGVSYVIDHDTRVWTNFRGHPDRMDPPLLDKCLIDTIIYYIVINNSI